MAITAANLVTTRGYEKEIRSAFDAMIRRITHYHETPTIAQIRRDVADAASGRTDTAMTTLKTLVDNCQP